MLKGLNSWKILGLLYVACLFGAGTPVQAQDNTVYSRYGLGLLNQNNFIPSRAMGGLGAAYRSPENVNFANPASYATLNLISFETGLAASVNRASNNVRSERSGSVNLAYLNFALPVKKDLWVSVIGVIPFSQHNYVLVDTTATGAGIANLFEGSGTIYTAYWGNGFKYRDFSVGFNIGYIFGNTSNATISVPLDGEGFLDPAAFTSFERRELYARGLYWNVGAQYSFSLTDKIVDKIRREMKLNVGMAYNSNYSLGNKSTLESSAYTMYSNLLNLKDDGESWSDFLDDILLEAAQNENAGLPGADIDTFRELTSESVNLRMPSNINAGFIFQRKVKEVEFWQAGMDFKWTQWTKFKGAREDSGDELSNSWRVAVGGEVFPLGSGRNTGQLKSKIFSQLKYRGGFYYMKSPVTVSSTDIYEFGINFGIAIPIRLRLVNDEGFLGYRGVHAFSLGFEVGSRGTKQNDLVRDNFVRINFGISLNDKWFVKRKFN
jgi:hypothetical protein